MSGGHQTRSGRSTPTLARWCATGPSPRWPALTPPAGPHGTPPQLCTPQGASLDIAHRCSSMSIDLRRIRRGQHVHDPSTSGATGCRIRRASIIRETTNTSSITTYPRGSSSARVRGPHDPRGRAASMPAAPHRRDRRDRRGLRRAAHLIGAAPKPIPQPRAAVCCAAGRRSAMHCLTRRAATLGQGHGRSLGQSPGA